MNTFLLSLLLTSYSLTPLNDNELTPKEIIQKSIDLINGKSSKAITDMTIVRPTYERTVSMKSWSLGEEYYIIYITAPARDRGQVFLKRGNEMWNWVPNINRMIKIPASMMGQSWMGSDFTNDDLVGMNDKVDDYEHNILGEEKVNGLNCYKIELKPKPDKPITWGKLILYISKENFYQMKSEFYNQNMELVTVMESSEIETLGGKTLPTKMVMTPIKKPGNKTIIKTKEQEFNIDIEESFFSQQNMKRIR